MFSRLSNSARLQTRLVTWGLGVVLPILSGCGTQPEPPAASSPASQPPAASVASAAPLTTVRLEVEPDRKAADWALKADAHAIRVLADGISTEIPKGGKIPDGPFQVIYINLWGSKNVSDEGIGYLQGLKYIRELNIGGIPITKLDFLEGMQNGLEQLILAQTQITDAGLVPVRNLVKLKRLNLWGVPVSDAGLAHLRGLKELQSLVIAYSQITDQGAEHLANLTNLEELDIARTQIGDTSLEKVAALTKLQSLNLSGTKITDKGLSHLKDLKNLRNLELHDNAGITDVGLARLQGLQQMQTLYLYKTGVTDAGVNSLQERLPNLKISREPR